VSKVKLSMWSPKAKLVITHQCPKTTCLGTPRAGPRPSSLFEVGGECSAPAPPPNMEQRTTRCSLVSLGIRECPVRVPWPREADTPRRSLAAQTRPRRICANPAAQAGAFASPLPATRSRPELPGVPPRPTPPPTKPWQQEAPRFPKRGGGAQPRAARWSAGPSAAARPPTSGRRWGGTCDARSRRIAPCAR